MTSAELFVHLLLRLRHHADAAVLWVLIKERADVRELKTTSMDISHVQLAGMVDRWTVRRSINSLQASGLVSVRIHRKTATLISVDRQAVLSLLRTPLDERLPGLSRKAFPFLAAWSDDLEGQPVQLEEASPQPSAVSGAPSTGLASDVASAASDAAASLS
jgi:hypothetical protein